MTWLGALVLALVLGIVRFADAGVLDATWTAPTTNTDGSPLTDLASYRVYYGTTPTPCPGGTFVVQPSPTTSPAPTTTVKLTNGLSGLVTGSRYYVSVTAVATGGNQSVCSGVANMIARADASPPPPPPPPPPPGPTVNFGETTAPLPEADNGNGNLLLTQPATLATAGTLTSLSFFVGPVTGGTLRLGLYSNGTDNRPGTKLAETAAFVPVVGWNTQPVVTSVFLPPGTYWLAYFPSSNTLAFPVTRVPTAGTHWLAPVTFGSMPATFPANATSGVSHWSLYGTVMTTPPPPMQFTLLTAIIGQGAVAGGGVYAAGTSVPVTATPAPGWVFTGWSGACPGLAPCVVLMDANKSVTATFALVPPAAFTLTTAVIGQGTISPATGAYVAGSSVPVTAQPAAGWAFAGWSGACLGVGPCTVLMDANKSVTAIFTAVAVNPPAPLVTQRCTIRVDATGKAPDTTTGWLLQLFNGTTSLSPAGAALARNVEVLQAKEGEKTPYAITARWTKAGQPTWTSLVKAGTCP